MKHLVLVVGAAILLTLLLGSSPSGTTSTPLKARQLSIRVTSNTPGQVITFEGAYMFHRNGPEYKSIKGTTPFEIGRTAKLVSGIFHKISGNGDLKVEILTQEGNNKNAVVSGWGDAVVVGTSQDEGHHFFVQSF